MIKFYYEYLENGFLSNYYPCRFFLDGKYWNAVEYYYQAQKSVDVAFSNRIRLAPTCDAAKALGNSPECHVRPDWETYKNIAMRHALEAKFTQNLDLKQRLLATGDEELAENSQHDFYWGLGNDGSGKSMLGRMLMELRSELRG